VARKPPPARVRTETRDNRPAKVAGRHLSPFLADRLGEALPSEAEPPQAWAADAVPVELAAAALEGTR